VHTLKRISSSTDYKSTDYKGSTASMTESCYHYGCQTFLLPKCEECLLNEIGLGIPQGRNKNFPKQEKVSKQLNLGMMILAKIKFQFLLKYVSEMGVYLFIGCIENIRNEGI
jgi:hypothetical protein